MWHRYHLRHHHVHCDLREGSEGKCHLPRASFLTVSPSSMGARWPPSMPWSKAWRKRAAGLGWEMTSGRQDMVKGVLSGMAASLMTSLAACQGGHVTPWLKESSQPWDTFFPPCGWYLFFSEAKRKQNVLTKLSALKLYCSSMAQGEKLKGNEEEGEHFWIRPVVLSLKGEEDFAGWRTALLYSTVSKEQRTRA